MIVQCPSCGKKYKFADEKIKPEGTKVKCPNCGYIFVVFPPRKKEETEKYVIKTPDGIELGPYSLEALKDLIKRGEIEGNEKISISGGEFVPITEVEELKGLLPQKEGEEKVESGEDDLFSDFDIGEEEVLTSTGEISTGEINEELFDDDLNFDTSEEEGEEDLFGEISADELEKGGSTGEEDIFDSEDLDFGTAEEIEGMEGEFSVQDDEKGSEKKVSSEETFDEESFEEDIESEIESDENLAEEVEEEEIATDESFEVPTIEEREEGFLDESFEEEGGEEALEKRKIFSIRRILFAGMIVVVVAFIAIFFTLLFVPDLSNSPGIVGKADLFVQKLFNTRFYQEKRLEDIKSTIFREIKNRNGVELKKAIEEIETFLKETDLEDAEKKLFPLLFELYLQLNEVNYQESLEKRIDYMYAKFKNEVSPYLMAYYLYLNEKFEDAKMVIKGVKSKSQKVRLLAGKIERATGDYKTASSLLNPVAYSKNFNFIAWKETGILHELEKNYKKAISDYINGIKANRDYLYNYLQLLRLVTGKNMGNIPHKYLFYLKRVLGRISLPEEQAEIHYLLSLYSFERKDFSQAMAEINNALKIRKDFPDYLLLKGKIFYEQGKLVDAFLVLQKSIEKNPHSPEALLFLGKTAEGLKKLDKAEEYYRKALKINPDYVDAYIALSSLYLKQRKLDRALEVLNRALETLSDNVQILLQEAKIFIQRKNLDKAERILKKAYSLDPTNADVLLSFSELLVYRGKYREALTRINAVIKKHPYSDKAYFFRGLAYYNLGQYSRAVDDFKKAKIINQRDPDYYLMLGKSLYKLKKYEEAVNVLERALDLNPNLDEAYFYIALSYFEEKSFFQAEDAIKKAITLAPDNAVYHYYLGLVYEKESRSGYAFDEFKKAVSLNSSYIPALLRVGEYYFNLGDFEEAESTYLSFLAIAKGRDKSKAYFLLGKTYLAAGEPNKAYEYLRKAILSGYKTSESYTILGEAMEDLGMQDSAILMYKKAVRLDFKNPIPHYRLGKYYKSIGDFSSARKELKLALKFNPPSDIKDEIERLLRIISYSSP